MKIRSNYVSNSSSSSFIVSKDVSDITPCIKLSDEIIKAFEKNYIDEDGNHINLSEISNEWWLTDLISDSYEKFSDIYDMKNAIMYLDGHETPYDWYDNPKSYTVFRKNYVDFYMKNDDLFGANKEDMPSGLEFKEKIKMIIKNNHLNKTQKINAIKHFLDI